jgi:hypothetical protein
MATSCCRELMIALWCGIVMSSVAALPPVASAADALAGNYRGFYSGQAVPSLQPESGLLLVTLDGQGNLTGVESYNNGVRFCSNVTLTGTYVVAAGGEGGSVTVQGDSPVAECRFSFTALFIVLNNGALLKFMTTGTGFVLLNEEWHRVP